MEHLPAEIESPSGYLASLNRINFQRSVLNAPTLKLTVDGWSSKAGGERSSYTRCQEPQSTALLPLHLPDPTEQHHGVCRAESQRLWPCRTGYLTGELGHPSPEGPTWNFGQPLHTLGTALHTNWGSN